MLAPPLTSPLPDEQRAALQRRVLRTLTVSQMIGSGAVTTAVTIGAFVVQDILGETTGWAGIASASSTAGGALLAQVLARLMARRGRRPGLLLGYLVAAAGGAVAAVGVQRQMLAVFLVGVGLFGGGQASNLLSRYVATDLALPSEQGRAMSRVVFSSAFGAVLGPLLAGPAQRAGTAWFGLDTYTGPWLAGAVLFLVGAAHLAFWLRPDPLVASGGLSHTTRTVGPLGLIGALRVVSADPSARLALGAMAASQGTMVAVMTMTPVHMKVHGHETTSLYVISLHIAGMFAFSPIVGRIVDRYGPRSTVVAGAFLLVAATMTAALSGDVEQLLFPALWMLGLAWSFGLIAGSALLQRSVPARVRVSVQGSADLVMVASGSVAGLASGFVRQAFGYHLLSTGAAIVAVVLADRALRSRRRHAVPVVVAASPAGHATIGD